MIPDEDLAGMTYREILESLCNRLDDFAREQEQQTNRRPSSGAGGATPPGGMSRGNNRGEKRHGTDC